MILVVNLDIIPYVIKQNLHVEYFLWCYLRAKNENGFHSLNSINFNKFCQSTIKLKLKDNMFFLFKNNNFVLNGKKNIINGKKNYVCDFMELNRFANKITLSGNIIKKWNSTLIKYFLISIYACRHENKQPYALSLISEDLDVSPKTIQRSLEVFGVQRTNKRQKKYSPRSYYYEGEQVNLSPNYYFMSLGEIF